MIEAIEPIKVFIVVAYCETKVFLLLFSDRLLDLTRRRRSRRDISAYCRRGCQGRASRSLRKRAYRQREGTNVDSNESIHGG